jgi:O-antigen ligase
MPFREPDYEPLRPSRKIAAAEGEVLDDSWLPSRKPAIQVESVAAKEVKSAPAVAEEFKPTEIWSRSKGHTFTFVMLIVYTALAYFRPYELSPALEWTVSLPFWIAVAMLVIFIPSQFMAEGNVTARPKEVNLALLLGLIAIISIPQAIDRWLAWETFYTLYSKTLIVFIVMVNAVRTERRLRTILLFALLTGGIMSITALADFSSGNTGVYTERATAAISNMFGEPNSLAMHLVTMIPIALAFSFGSKNVFKKLLYLGGSLVMIAGVFATYSRGGFLGLAVAGLVFAWKVGRKNRFAVVGLVFIAAVAAMLFAPGGYGSRVVSIFNPAADSSSSQRRALLTRSIWVALTSPFLGVGIGNGRVVLLRDQVSHNAYTQIAGDMGLIAFTLYMMFLIIPYKRLASIERETLKEEHHSRYYYLVIGLQASLAGFMVSSFFLSVAYDWYGYFLVAYAICFRRAYQQYKETAITVNNSPQIA